MYKRISIGLLGFLIVLIMPFNISEDETEQKFYGAATILVRDADGNQLFQQTIHNQLVDTGETFILQQTFQDGNSTAVDAAQIGAICISPSISSLGEGTTAANFDGNVTAFNSGAWVGSTNCKEDTSVDMTTQGKAVIGFITFTAVTNLPDGETINGIGICPAQASVNTDFEGCATSGPLFAFVDTSNVQLSGTEEVDITYTFDITSSTT